MDCSSKPHGDEHEAMARAAAAEAGIPGLWHRLRGDTREELRADAEELAYERDHPPDQATLDREAAENEARIAECKEQVAANKAGEKVTMRSCATGVRAFAYEATP